MLNQQQYASLKSEGFTDTEIAEAMQEVQKEQQLRQNHQSARQANIDPRAFSQPSAFSYNPNDNLIKWQLELNEILERIEHILRGDIVQYQSGNSIWKKIPEDHKDRVLNDYGVQEVLRILSMYLNIF